MSKYAHLLVGTAVLAVPAIADAQTAPAEQPAPVTTAPAPAPATTTATTPATTAPAATAPAASQPVLPPDVTGDYGDDTESQTIVVQGVKPRGSVIGDIPPEQTLDSRDIMATGATNINDLLDALAPQIGSVQGRGGEQPVFLLNGQRISGFRELRDIPPEAIERIDILPEEVALKYGYGADQKVVNIVLRRFFRSTTAMVKPQVATEGGYTAGTGDLTKLLVGNNGRTSFNLHAEGNGILTESERDVSLQQPPDTSNATDDRSARSLIASKRDVRGAATFNRHLFGHLYGTLNTEVEHNEGESLFGLSDVDASVLRRHTSDDTAHAGMVLNWGTKWQWSSTANADYDHNVTRSDDRFTSGAIDRAESTTESGNADLTAHGNLLKLPAGNASTTAKVAVSTTHESSNRTGPQTPGEGSHSIARTAGSASLSLDLPISRRNSDFGALGNLTLNGNAGVQQLSDFGTLTNVGAGANWSPAQRLEFITSWTDEQGPPTVAQLGDPELVTPGSPIFDFTTGQTVLVTAITGGNPALQADRRRALKLGTNWQPFQKLDLRFRAEYVHEHIDHPIEDIPGPTLKIEEAFPDRFVRNAQGQLISVDFRPVNFDSSRRDQVRIGFDFTHPLKSAAPSAATIAAFRQRAAAAGIPVPSQGNGSQGGQQERSSQNNQTGGKQAEGNQAQGNQAQSGNGSSQSASAGSPPEGRRGGFRGAGRFFGGRNGGRVTFSLTDTITLVDKVMIRPGLDLDYLHGDAVGQTGGEPRHNVQARAGYFNNGLGGFFSANWRSGTEVDSATGDNLRFSPYATFNLKLFANVGQRPDLVLKHPWLRGASVQFEVDNIFDSKPQVHAASGHLPFNYQPDLLEPLGRTISITFRKLFLPPPSFYRRYFQQQREARGG